MTTREEIQITDLEPSIEGGEDINYIVQIRGIDATGRPGPWSQQFEFASPAQIPSLESTNYVPGETGWKLDNDGSFEVNNGTIRGTLASSNYSPGVSGWTLTDDGNVEFSTGIFRGALQIGTNTFNVDSNGNMFIGGGSLNTSPFAVDTNGNIVAMSLSANFITAGQLQSGVIYAGAIDADQINAGFLSVDRLEVNSINGNRISNGSIGDEKIDSLAADKILAGQLAAGVIYAGAISANQISGGSLSGISVSALNLSASGAFNVQSGRLRVDIGGGVISNTTISASSHMSASSFRVGVGGSDPQYTKSSSDPYINNPSGTLRVENIIALNTGVSLTWSTSTGRVYRPSSSRKTKKDIQYIEKINNLLDAKLAIFKPRMPWEIEGSEGVYEEDFYEPGADEFQVGMIAEDLDELGLTYLVEYDQDKKPSGIKYDKIGAVLIPYIKEMQDKIQDLERKVNGN